MKTFINQSKVRRRALLSNLVSVGGLVLLLVSVVVPLFLPALANTAYIAMIAGMGIAMIGIYFANRWVRKPRPEESLAQALKSLDQQYRLFHYPSLPSDHLLLTPTGVVVLEAINLAGKFSYQQGRWKEAMNMGRALRYIVEEHLGDPIGAARREAEDLQELFRREWGAEVSIPIKPMVVFTHPAVNLEIKEPPIPVCRVDKLKKQVLIPSARLAAGLYDKLALFLEGRTR